MASEGEVQGMVTPPPSSSSMHGRRRRASSSSTSTRGEEVQLSAEEVQKWSDHLASVKLEAEEKAFMLSSQIRTLQKKLQEKEKENRRIKHDLYLASPDLAPRRLNFNQEVAVQDGNGPESGLLDEEYINVDDGASTDNEADPVAIAWDNGNRAIHGGDIANAVRHYTTAARMLASNHATSEARVSELEAELEEINAERELFHKRAKESKEENNQLTERLAQLDTMLKTKDEELFMLLEAKENSERMHAEAMERTEKLEEEHGAKDGVINSLQNQLHELNQRNAVLEHELSELRQSQGSQVEQLTSQLEEMESQIQSKNSELAALMQQFQEKEDIMEKMTAEIESTKPLLDELEQLKASSQNQINELTQQVHEKENNFRSLEERFDSLSLELRQQRSNVKELTESKQFLETEIEQLQADNNQLKEKLEALTTEREGLLENNSNQHGALSEEIMYLKQVQEEKDEELANALQTNKTLTEQLNEVNSSNDETLSKLADALKANDDLQLQINQLETARTEMEQETSDQDILVEQLEKEKREKEELIKAMNDLESKLCNDLQTVREELEDKKDSFRKLARRYKKLMEEKNDNEIATTSEINPSKELMEQIQRLENEKEQLREKAEEFKEEVQRLSEENADLEARLASKDTELRDMSSSNQAKAMEDSISERRISELQNKLKDSQKHALELECTYEQLQSQCEDQTRLLGERAHDLEALREKIVHLQEELDQANETNYKLSKQIEENDQSRNWNDESLEFDQPPPVPTFTTSPPPPVGQNQTSPVGEFDWGAVVSSDNTSPRQDANEWFDEQQPKDSFSQQQPPNDDNAPVPSLEMEMQLSTLQSNLDQAQRELKDTKNRINAVLEEQDRSNQYISSLKDELNQARYEIEGLNQQVDGLTQQVDDYEAQLSTQETRESDLLRQVDELQAQLLNKSTELERLREFSPQRSPPPRRMIGNDATPIESQRSLFHQLKESQHQQIAWMGEGQDEPLESGDDVATVQEGEPLQSPPVPNAAALFSEQQEQQVDDAPDAAALFGGTGQQPFDAMQNAHDASGFFDNYQDENQQEAFEPVQNSNDAAGFFDNYQNENQQQAFDPVGDANDASGLFDTYRDEQDQAQSQQQDEQPFEQIQNGNDASGFFDNFEDDQVNDTAALFQQQQPEAGVGVDEEKKHLEARVWSLKEQLEAKNMEVEKLMSQLNTTQRHNSSSLEEELRAKSTEIESLTAKLNSQSVVVESLQAQLPARVTEIGTLKMQIQTGEKELEELRSELATKENDLFAKENDLTALNNILREKEEEIARLGSTVASSEEINGQLQGAREEVESLRSELAVAQDESSSLGAKIEALESDVLAKSESIRSMEEQLQMLATKDERIRELETDLSGLSEQLESVNEENARLQKNLFDLEIQKGELEVKAKDLNDTLEKLQVAHDELQSTSDSYKVELDKMDESRKKSLESLESLTAEVATLKQDLDAKSKELHDQIVKDNEMISELRSSVQALEMKNEDLVAADKRMTKEVETLREAQKSWETDKIMMENEQREAEQRQRDLESQVADLEQQASSLEEKNAELRTQLKDTAKLDEMGRELELRNQALASLSVRATKLMGVNKRLQQERDRAYEDAAAMYHSNVSEEMEQNGGGLRQRSRSPPARSKGGLAKVMLKSSKRPTFVPPVSSSDEEEDVNVIPPVVGEFDQVFEDLNCKLNDFVPQQDGWKNPMTLRAIGNLLKDLEECKDLADTALMAQTADVELRQKLQRLEHELTETKETLQETERKALARLDQVEQLQRDLETKEQHISAMEQEYEKLQQQLAETKVTPTLSPNQLEEMNRYKEEAEHYRQMVQALHQEIEGVQAINSNPPVTSDPASHQINNGSNNQLETALENLSEARNEYQAAMSEVDVESVKQLTHDVQECLELLNHFAVMDKAAQASFVEQGEEQQQRQRMVAASFSADDQRNVSFALTEVQECMSFVDKLAGTATHSLMVDTSAIPRSPTLNKGTDPISSTLMMVSSPAKSPTSDMGTDPILDQDEASIPGNEKVLVASPKTSYSEAGTFTEPLSTATVGVDAIAIERREVGVATTDLVHKGPEDEDDIPENMEELREAFVDVRNERDDLLRKQDDVNKKVSLLEKQLAMRKSIFGSKSPPLPRGSEVRKRLNVSSDGTVLRPRSPLGTPTRVLRTKFQQEAFGHSSPPPASMPSQAVGVSGGPSIDTTIDDNVPAPGSPLVTPWGDKFWEDQHIDDIPLDDVAEAGQEEEEEEVQQQQEDIHQSWQTRPPSMASPTSVRSSYQDSDTDGGDASPSDFVGVASPGGGSMSTMDGNSPVGLMSPTPSTPPTSHRTGGSPTPPRGWGNLMTVDGQQQPVPSESGGFQPHQQFGDSSNNAKQGEVDDDENKTVKWARPETPAKLGPNDDGKGKKKKKGKTNFMSAMFGIGKHRDNLETELNDDNSDFDEDEDNSGGSGGGGNPTKRSRRDSMSDPFKAAAEIRSRTLSNLSQKNLANAGPGQGQHKPTYPAYDMQSRGPTGIVSEVSEPPTPTQPQPGSPPPPMNAGFPPMNSPGVVGLQSPVPTQQQGFTSPQFPPLDQQPEYDQQDQYYNDEYGQYPSSQQQQPYDNGYDQQQQPGSAFEYDDQYHQQQPYQTNSYDQEPHSAFSNTEDYQYNNYEENPGGLASEMNETNSPFDDVNDGVFQLQQTEEEEEMFAPPTTLENQSKTSPGVPVLQWSNVIDHPSESPVAETTDQSSLTASKLYTGVSWDDQNQVWIATSLASGDVIGSFHSEKLAALAVDMNNSRSINKERENDDDEEEETHQQQLAGTKNLSLEEREMIARELLALQQVLEEVKEKTADTATKLTTVDEEKLSRKLCDLEKQLEIERDARIWRERQYCITESELLKTVEENDMLQNTIQSLEVELDQVKQENQKLHGEIQSYRASDQEKQSALDRANVELDSMRQQLNRATNDVSAVSNNAGHLNDELSRAQAAAAKASADVNRLRALLAEREEDFNYMMKNLSLSIYARNPQAPSAILNASSSPSARQQQQQQPLPKDLATVMYKRPSRLGSLAQWTYNFVLPHLLLILTTFLLSVGTPPELLGELRHMIPS